MRLCISHYLFLSVFFIFLLFIHPCNVIDFKVEDYIIGYLGESKMVKDFYREFLNKRIELRPRMKASLKDVLALYLSLLNFIDLGPFWTSCSIG